MTTGYEPGDKAQLLLQYSSGGGDRSIVFALIASFMPRANIEPPSDGRVEQISPIAVLTRCGIAAKCETVGPVCSSRIKRPGKAVSTVVLLLIVSIIQK